MKSFKAVCSIIFLSSMAINTAQAATDYNSSRANRAENTGVVEVTDGLLRESNSGALTVTKSMIAVDQKDGYDGEYNVTVKVSVSIERTPKGRDPASGLPTGKR